MDDESGGSMEPMEEVSLAGLRWARIGKIGAWLTLGVRKKRPETSEV